MKNLTDKLQHQRSSKEVVTVKDVTIKNYDIIVMTHENLTESTERAAAASKGSVEAIEALDNQIKVSIEEMGKSVTENLCRALSETMREVLTSVLKSRDQPQGPVRGAAVTASAEESSNLVGLTTPAEDKTAERQLVGVVAGGDLNPTGAATGAARDEKEEEGLVFSGPGLLPAPTA
ncbi:unnamed protein product [Linum trigynum]|uniref:Uncharacterized protein n=1 Tax=Linum trigynum TaxID=586398 RepID=A0AAV2GSI6_9ROSI